MRRIKIQFDGIVGDLFIGPLTIGQLNKFANPTKENPVTRFEVVAWSLNNLEQDAESWTAERVTDTFDQPLFNHIWNELMLNSGIKLTDSAAKVVAPGESVAASAIPSATSDAA